MDIPSNPIPADHPLDRLSRALGANEARSKMLWSRDRGLDKSHDPYTPDELLAVYAPYLMQFKHWNLEAREVRLLETCINALFTIPSHDTQLLHYLEQLFQHCPHTELSYTRPDEAEWSEHAPGWTLSVSGCETTTVTEPTLRECLALFMSTLPGVTSDTLKPEGGAQ